MDPYKILGISKDASDDDIKKAYRKLAMKYHPDRQTEKSDKEKKDAESKFKEVNEAYSILSDPQKKRNYDQFGNIDLSGFDMSGFNPFDAFDLSDIFGHAGKKSRHQESRVPRGGDLRINVHLGIEDLFKGANKKVKYHYNKRCHTCNGAGGIGMETCPDCHGSGQIVNTSQTQFGMFQQISPCMKCQGKGYIWREPCMTCHGTGSIVEERTTTIQIPSGIPENSTIRMTSLGNDSIDSKGNPGDLYVNILYDYDKTKFGIDGLNVYESIEVPYYDALLGTIFEHKLKDGFTMKVNIKPCTKDGESIPITGHGLRIDHYNMSYYPFLQYNKQGNYYLVVRYAFPDKLSPEEKKLLEKIKVQKTKEKNSNG